MISSEILLEIKEIVRNWKFKSVLIGDEQESFSSYARIESVDYDNKSFVITHRGGGSLIIPFGKIDDVEFEDTSLKIWTTNDVYAFLDEIS